MEDLDLATLTQSAEEGIPSSQWTLASWYFAGFNVTPDSVEAIRWCRRAAENGSPYAQFRLSEAYFRGDDGLAKDLNEALKWTLLVAGQSEVRHLQSHAQHQLAHMYFVGAGVEKDDIAARQWMLLSADNGRIESQHTLANMYFDGNGIEQSYPEAFKWYERAFAKGGANGTHMRLAFMNFHGLGVPQNYEKAMELYLAAIEDRQDDDARKIIGFMYEFGLGVQQDYEQAIQWYNSMYFSNSEVSARLGYFYQYGLGVAQDYKTAHQHYAKAGPPWSHTVLNSIALMYDLGLGVPIDKKFAYALYRFTHSHSKADKLKGRMTDEDVALGQDLAEKLEDGCFGIVALQERIQHDA